MSIGLGLNIGIGIGAMGKGGAPVYPFNFTLSAISGAVPIVLVTSRAGSVVDWGDGTTTTLVSGTNNLSHTYSVYSTASVSISDAQYITQIAYAASTASLGCTTTALPRGLTSLFIAGSNTLSGDVVGLPRGITYMYVAGSSTLSGDVVGLPRGITYLNITGSSTIGGDVVGLPRGITAMYVTSPNTLSGDVVGLPSGLTYMYVTGDNTINAYTARSWPSTMNRIYLVPVAPGGLSAAQVDQWLIDLATYVTTWTDDKQVLLTGTNAPRTAASNAAVTALQGRGVAVTTN